MIKTVIFDLDGTTLDTLTDLYTAIDYMLVKRGYPRVSKEHLRFAVGNGAQKMIERCIPEGEAVHYDECLALFKEKYELCKNDNTAPYCGTLETMRALKDRGVRIAVVSNKVEFATVALCEKWFGSLVDCALGDNGTRPLKPDPAPIEYVLEKLGGDKKSTVYVGDQEIDVQTAANAGVELLGAGWGFRGCERLKNAGVDKVFGNFDELKEYLLSNLY